jgi:hypothetical protein
MTIVLIRAKAVARASQLQGPRARRMEEGCDGEGSLLEEGSGNVGRRGAGGLFEVWQLFGVGWCRVRFC